MQQLAQMLEEHFQGKTVLVTGHTGFKGPWLCEWLLMMGAKVVGVGLDPVDESPLFSQLHLEERVDHHILDIRNSDALAGLVKVAQPDILFHMAAQSLVGYSYDHPLETFHTNVLGSAHVLNALRELDAPCEAVIVTSDKCYENREQCEPYTEDDSMGGYDPYSASKGAAEIIISSFRRSFFHPDDYGRSHWISVASARSGNVIGGGDWALDRIVPDCMRSLARGDPIEVRSPDATRPWQHVLEPLCGYLILAMRLAQANGPDERAKLCSGFNFGPDPSVNYPVRDLVKQVLNFWPGEWIDRSDPNAMHEAGLLNLAIGKARRLLGWVPIWDFETSVSRTVQWYQAVLADSSCALEFTLSQIRDYMEEFDCDI